MQIVTKESVGGYVELRTGQWGSRLFYPGSGEGERRSEVLFCSWLQPWLTNTALTRMDLRPCGINVYGEGIVFCLCPASLRTVYGMP